LVLWEKAEIHLIYKLIEVQVATAWWSAETIKRLKISCKNTKVLTIHIPV